MASDYLKLLILGNIGSEPELKYTQGGEPHLNFSIAANEEWVSKDKGKQKRTTWVRCTIWGKRGEALARYLTSGSRILVDGKLQIREYVDRDGAKQKSVECTVQEVTFAGGKTKTDGAAGGGGGGKPRGGAGRGQAPPQESDAGPPDEGADGGTYGNDDDIPF